MKSVLILLTALCFLSIACGSDPVPDGSTTANVNAAPANPTGRRPVLVEMFTSEGCPNCPQADNQLAFLETQQPIAGADIITLGYHVDYFNDRGWKDEYSNPQYTKRQQLYSMRLGAGDLYTPQMIVDGQTQFIGSDPAKVTAAIGNAIATQKAEVNATGNGGSAEVTITGLGRHMAGTAVLAIAEDGLVSRPNSGSNRGRTLKHISVVRGLVPFGKVAETAEEFRGSVQLPTDPGWKNVRYIVFVQEDMSGRIIASGRVKTS